MKSSLVSPDPDAMHSSAPLVAEGGVRSVVAPAADWFEALDGLMSVVEALCPTWPARDAFGPMPDVRL